MIYDEWIAAKEAERVAVEKRRILEDQMTMAFGFDPAEDGSKTITDNGYKVKVSMRLNHKIDSEKLQELAREAGVTDHLSMLFRWKPEINATAWKNTDKGITNALTGAITTTPGRPSYAIEKIGE